MKNKIGHLIVREDYIPSVDHVQYREFMTKELLARPRPPKPVVPTHFNGKLVKDLSESERQDFYFSQQPPSTQAAMLRQKERDPSEDLDYLLRPMPNCIANPEAKTLEDLIGTRTLKADEVLIVENNRRTGKNSLGDSKQSSVGAKSRQAAIEAFTYSRPAELTEAEWRTVKKLTELEKAIPQPDKIFKIPKTPFSLFKYWDIFICTMVGWTLSKEEKEREKEREKHADSD